MPWYLHRLADGSVEQVQCAHHPCDPPAPGASPAYDWKRNTVIELPRQGDLEIERWTGSEWVLRMEPLRARLLLLVDAQRDRMEAQLSARLAHQRKRGEVLALSADPALDPAETPWLAAEASATGQTIAQVAAGVKDAMAIDEAECARLEAAAIAGKAAIRAANTIAGVQAAFDAIDWGQT